MDAFSLFGEIFPQSALPSTDAEAVKAMYRRMQHKLQIDRPQHKNESNCCEIQGATLVDKKNPPWKKREAQQSYSPLKSQYHKKTTEKLIMDRELRRKQQRIYPALPQASYELAKNILTANQELNEKLNVPANAALSSSWIDYDGLDLSLSREDLHNRAVDTRNTLLTKREVRKLDQPTYPDVPTDSFFPATRIVRYDDDILLHANEVPQTHTTKGNSIISPIKSPISEYSQNLGEYSQNFEFEDCS